jgi:hypothetical protein
MPGIKSAGGAKQEPLTPLGSLRMWSSKRAGDDPCHACTGAAGDAVDAHGLEGFRQGHRRQTETSHVRRSISTEESGERAFGSRLELDFAGGDVAVGLGPRGEGCLTRPQGPLIAHALRVPLEE